MTPIIWERSGILYLDEKLIEDMHEMGKRTALAATDETTYGGWFGDEGTCPVCHQNLLSVNGTTTVECPLCGIEGTLSVDNGRLHVEFSKEQQERARGTFKGLREHTGRNTGLWRYLRTEAYGKQRHA